MATTLVSVEQYLTTTYRPDCDYIDGVVVERNLGQFDHATLQMLVLMALQAHALEWGILVRPELRIQVRAGKYRVPDVTVLRAGIKHPAVIQEAPLLCIEIVSPDDRLKDLTDRAQDYLAIGVPETWILDPGSQAAFVYSVEGLHQVQSDVLQAACGCSLDLPALFAGLV